MDLSDWRNEIDEIDTELLRLLQRRASIVAEIGKIKAIRGIALLDEKREAEILNRIGQRSQTILSIEAVTCVFQCIIEESRRIQAEIMSKRVELC